MCNTEMKVLLSTISCDEKVRDHCGTHDANELKLNEKELVQTFARFNGRRLWYPRMLLLEAVTNEKVFAYLTWPKERLLEIWGTSGAMTT
jgi:hypothetical protein